MCSRWPTSELSPTSVTAAWCGPITIVLAREVGALNITIWRSTMHLSVGHCWWLVKPITGQAPFWLVLKEKNTRRPLFFSACVRMVLVNNISARKKSRREVGGPAQRLQARQSSNSRLTGEHSTPTLDFFRAISAGECLVVSTVTLSPPDRVAERPPVPIVCGIAVRCILDALASRCGLLLHQPYSHRVLAWDVVTADPPLIEGQSPFCD
jgi:hypothetical protein